jgi:hypothetical protein
MKHAASSTSTMKMKTICSSEKSPEFHRTARRQETEHDLTYISDDTETRPARVCRPSEVKTCLMNLSMRAWLRERTKCKMIYGSPYKVVSSSVDAVNHVSFPINCFSHDVTGKLPFPVRELFPYSTSQSILALPFRVVIERLRASVFSPNWVD